MIFIVVFVIAFIIVSIIVNALQGLYMKIVGAQAMFFNGGKKMAAIIVISLWITIFLVSRMG